MRESELQRHVIELAQMLGWLVYHTYDSRRSQSGFPDLVMARRPRVIFAELKSARGRLRPEQRRWETELGGQEYYLWRPADWDDIQRILR